MQRTFRVALGVLVFLPAVEAVEEWEEVLKVAVRSERSQTRRDGLAQIDTTTAKGLRELWKVLGNRDPLRVDWFVREGAYEALLNATGPEAEEEIEKVLKGSGKEFAKEAIIYSVAWKIRKEVAKREGGNDDRKLAEVKYLLRKARGTDYFALVLPTIQELDPEGKYWAWLERGIADKSARVRRAAINGLLSYPRRKNVPLLLENLKKMKKPTAKNFREWVLNRQALETLTGQYYRDNVKDWFRWWDVVKGTFSIEDRVEDASGATSNRTVVVSQGVEVTVHMKVVGNGYPLLVLPWRGYEPDYFRPYFHGVEEFCKAYYIRMPQLDDFKGLRRDAAANVVRYPTQILADGLVDIMKKSGLEKFALLAHGWEASHLAMLLTRDYRDRVSHVVLVNPWAGGDSFRRAVRNIRNRGDKLRNQEIIKGADSRIFKDERPTYVATDDAEAGGISRALFNMHFADPTEPEIGTLRFLYRLPGGASVFIDPNWQARKLLQNVAAGLPALVVSGLRSGWTGADEPKKVVGVFKDRGRLLTFKRSADFPFVSEPYRFTKELEKFLAPALRKRGGGKK